MSSQRGIEKKAFDPTVLLGPLAAHLGINAAIKAGLQTEMGGKFLKKLVDRDKPLNPVVEGLIEAFLGPEFVEMHHKAVAKKVGDAALNSRKRRLIRNVAAFGPTIASVAAGVPVVPDVTLVNNVRGLIARGSSEELKTKFMFGSLKAGLEKGNIRRAKAKALLFSPALGLAEEYAAKVSRGEPIKIPGAVKTFVPELKNVKEVKVQDKRIRALSKEFLDKFVSDLEKEVRANPKKPMDKLYVGYLAARDTILKKSPRKLRGPLSKLLPRF